MLAKPNSSTDNQNSSTYPAFTELKSIVETQFKLNDSYIDNQGIPTFLLFDSNKQKFRNLVLKLAEYRLIPFLRKIKGNIILTIFMQPPQKKPKSVLFNFFLLIITLGTIFFAGYYGFTNTPVLSQELMKNENVLVQSMIFALSLFGIIGLHELGHLIACRIHRMDFSLPYFIPGPPPFGTFGAIVSLRSPPKNRDELFDTGLAGPLAGFIATIIVAILSLQHGFVVSLSQANIWLQNDWVQTVEWPMIPIIFNLLQPIIRPIPPGYTLILTHLEFAAWVGALITFLNILPVWQLDGGHISRAMWGGKGQKYASILGIAVLFATGYWVFAILLLFLMFRSHRRWRGAEPLDDVSSLSSTRKILYFGTFIILILCFVVITPL